MSVDRSSKLESVDRSSKHVSVDRSSQHVSVDRSNQAQLQGHDNKGLLKKPFLSHLGTCPSVPLSRFRQPEATITSISSISSCAAKIADTASMHIYIVCT